MAPTKKQKRVSAANKDALSNSNTDTNGDSNTHDNRTNNNPSKRLKNNEVFSSNFASVSTQPSPAMITNTCANNTSLVHALFNPSFANSNNNIMPSPISSDKRSHNSVPKIVVASKQPPAALFESNNSTVISSLEVSKINRPVLQSVVTEQFFPHVKFADKDKDLAWDDSSKSFCQWFIKNCNVTEGADKREWWNQARKIVNYIMSQTRNDRGTAVKNAFLGKCQFD